MGPSLFVWAAPGAGQQWMEVICAHRGRRTEVVDVHLNQTLCRSALLDVSSLRVLVLLVKASLSIIIPSELINFQLY